jgi:hypothetical protein
MRFYGEMRVQGSGPLDGARFDALAYALAEIEETDPSVDEVDLTASLAQGWITASMVIDQESLELAVAKLMATVRTAIYPNGDTLGGWKFLTETAGLTVQPAGDRAAGDRGAGDRGAGAHGPGGHAGGGHASGAHAAVGLADDGSADGGPADGGPTVGGRAGGDGGQAAGGRSTDGPAQVAQHVPQPS